MNIGTWCIIPSPEVVSVLAQRLDFIIIDKEHGNASNRDVLLMTLAAHEARASSFVRVSANDEGEILHALDSGADGIIVPHIETVQDIEKFIAYTTFPPEGVRGYTPFVYGGRYGIYKKVAKEYQNRCNRELLRGIIIESVAGLNNLDSILKTSIDLIYIGVYDLASSLGIAVDSLEIDTYLKEACEKIKASDKMAGAIFFSKENFKKLKELNISYCVYKTDTAILAESIEEIGKW